MPESVTQTTIEEIASMLLECRDQGRQPILFLGARTGGLFKNTYLYDTLEQFSLLNFDKLPGPKQFGECYHVLMGEYFDEDARREVLGNAFTQPTPLTYRHEDGLLSGLVKANFFKAIITTNIDTLLEQALNSWGMREPDDYRVYIEPDDIKTLGQTAIGERLIVKIFGDLNSLRYKIEDRRYKLEGSNSSTLTGLIRFLQTQLSENVVVIGYDAIWDHSIERAFPHEGDPIWYVNESPLEENSYLQSVLHLRKGKQLKEKLGSYRNFLKTLYILLGEKVIQQKAEVVPPVIINQGTNKERKGIFISCSYEDHQYLERLEIHLKGYSSTTNEKNEQEPVQIWNDMHLLAGEERSEKIKKALAQSKVAILLVSNRFLSSNTIHTYDLPIVLEEAKRGNIKLFSVILEPLSSTFDENRVALDQHTIVYNISKSPRPKKKYGKEVVWANLAREVFDAMANNV